MGEAFKFFLTDLSVKLRPGSPGAPFAPQGETAPWRNQGFRVTPSRSVFLGLGLCVEFFMLFFQSGE